jgi:hypothetical protein
MNEPLLAVLRWYRDVQEFVEWLIFWVNFLGFEETRLLAERNYPLFQQQGAPRPRQGGDTSSGNLALSPPSHARPHSDQLRPLSTQKPPILLWVAFDEIERLQERNSLHLIR